jgi:hypothetical protein
MRQIGLFILGLAVFTGLMPFGRIDRQALARQFVSRDLNRAPQSCLLAETGSQTEALCATQAVQRPATSPGAPVGVVAPIAIGQPWPMACPQSVLLRHCVQPCAP